MKLWILIVAWVALPILTSRAALAQTAPPVAPEARGGLAKRDAVTPGTDAGAREPGSPDEAEAESELSEAELRKLAEFRSAVRSIDVSSDTGTILGALEVLRDGFPDSRPVLHDCVRAGTAKTKAYALRVLGDMGTAKEDLDVAVDGLRDLDERVRLAAVMAVRRLGKDGMPELLAFLKKETSPNNRKMAIKTLQQWGDKDCVGDLVAILQKERDDGVRAFAFTALRVITRAKLGEDLEAWERYADALAVQKQAEDLLRKQAAETEAES